MTEQRNDGKEGRLETLYRQAGDVEPDAGLDRIIRARADAAGDSRRSSNRLPWLGGLVTASVAIVAITVVLQQAPPAGEPMPESLVPDKSAEPEAFMAPSLGADAELKSSSEGRRARNEVREIQSPAPDASGATPPAPPAELRAPGQTTPSRQQRAERLGDIVADRVSSSAEPERSPSEESSEESAEPSVETVAETVAETIADDPVAVLARIEALIERGELQRARESFELLKRTYPDYAVPEVIESALRMESDSDPK